MSVSICLGLWQMVRCVYGDEAVQTPGATVTDGARWWQRGRQNDCQAELGECHYYQNVVRAAHTYVCSGPGARARVSAHGWTAMIRMRHRCSCCCVSAVGEKAARIAGREPRNGCGMVWTHLGKTGGPRRTVETCGLAGWLRRARGSNLGERCGGKKNIHTHTHIRRASIERKNQVFQLEKESLGRRGQNAGPSTRAPPLREMAGHVLPDLATCLRERAGSDHLTGDRYPYPPHHTYPTNNAFSANVAFFLDVNLNAHHHNQRCVCVPFPRRRFSVFLSPF